MSRDSDPTDLIQSVPTSPDGPGWWETAQPVLRRKPWLTLSAALSTILVLLCLLVIGSARIYPFSPTLHAYGLESCDDVPCFRGVIPGQTSWSDARAVFDGRSAIFDDPMFASINLFPDADSESLAVILLDRPQEIPVTVNAVIGTFGGPSCLEIDRETDLLILHYPLVHVLTQFPENRFRPDSPVISFVVGDPQARANSAQILMCQDQGPHADLTDVASYTWRGFAFLRRYLETRS